MYDTLCYHWRAYNVYDGRSLRIMKIEEAHLEDFGPEFSSGCVIINNKSLFTVKDALFETEKKAVKRAVSFIRNKINDIEGGDRPVPQHPTIWLSKAKD